MGDVAGCALTLEAASPSTRGMCSFWDGSPNTKIGPQISVELSVFKHLILSGLKSSSPLALAGVYGYTNRNCKILP